MILIQERAQHDVLSDGTFTGNRMTHRETLKIAFMAADQEVEVRDFINGHPDATFGHHPGWAEVLREAYGKQVLFLLARNGNGSIAGVLPVADLSGVLFGKQWVSLPYQDYGGPLVSNLAVENNLVEALKRKASAQGCRLEIRCARPMQSHPAPDNDKVAMTLLLEGYTEETYWKKLDARVRNQVRKAEKSEVTLKRGGADQLDAFYSVFCVNSKSQGSPVHSRRFFESVLNRMPGTEIVTAWREGRCIGGLVRIRFRGVMAIPWAATLKPERIHCPNHAMYYDSIRTALQEGLKTVDFGRSGRDEGTFRYKIQWLAEASPLAWYPFDAHGNLLNVVAHPKSSLKLRWASEVWKRLPLPLVNWLGPRLRPSLAA